MAWRTLGTLQEEKGNIEAVAAISGSAQKTEVRTLERAGTGLIRDWGWRPVLRWNEERWEVDGLETRVRECEVDGVS